MLRASGLVRQRNKIVLEIARAGVRICPTGGSPTGGYTTEERVSFEHKNINFL